MAVAWNDDQRARVDTALAGYPVESNRCAEAARLVLLVAQEIDERARPRIIRPHPRYARARYVVPRTYEPSSDWTHHVTVEATAHHVDALTRSEGAPIDRYLETFFHAADMLVVEDVDLSRRDL